MRRLMVLLVVVGLGSVACASRGNIPTSDLVPRDLCTLGGVVDPVRGVLRGDPAATDWPVWLSRPAGHVIYVRWPFGWSARFASAGVDLVNEAGLVVASSGDEVVLEQVTPAEAAGTKGDPYVAYGLFLGGCYGRP